MKLPLAFSLAFLTACGPQLETAETAEAISGTQGDVVASSARFSLTYQWTLSASLTSAISRAISSGALRGQATVTEVLDAAALFGGLVITEQIFSIPGMGRLFLNALQQGDVNVLLAWMLVGAVFVVLFNLLADIVYGFLDPRIRVT